MGMIMLMIMFLAIACKFTVSAAIVLGFLYLLKRTKHKRRTLLIDDMRNIKADVIARTYDQGLLAIMNNPPFEVLYLDHDLGDPAPNKTGYDILNFIEVNPHLKPKKIVLVTSNPVGLQKMRVVIDKLYSRE